MYIKINRLKERTQNPLKDYLQMPIGRLFATPWHPGQPYATSTFIEKLLELSNQPREYK